jgi:hypothetical protein
MIRTKNSSQETILINEDNYKMLRIHKMIDFY